MLHLTLGDTLPMLTGRTPGAGPDLVQNNRRWMATALLLAVLAYGRGNGNNRPTA